MNKKKTLLVVAALPLLFLAILFAENETSKKQQDYSDNKEITNERTTLEQNSLIDNFRQKTFSGGKITTERTLSTNGNFTSYLISYPSDDLKIYGIMNIPKGNGPFPVVLLNHGYYNPSTFQSGDGTRSMAEILATNGYVTLASDYRGHGQSEGEGGGHRPEYAIDVLYLAASAKTVPQADTKRMGMWGHSMGGETSLRAVEINPNIKALVLWAPTTNRASHANSSFRTPNTPTPSEQNAAPLDFLEYIETPISLHQGLSDTEVDPNSSKELNNSLRDLGKNIEYFEYDGQDHNFQNLGWDLISKRTVDFFDKYLK